jgi:hypothetical protein
MIYRRVAEAMVVAGLIRVFVEAVIPAEMLAVDIHGVAAYLTVIGSLYGIIVAFLMFVVWEQFNHVQIGLDKEASALEDLCRVAEFLSERDSANRIRFTLRHYVQDTVSDEPQRLAMTEPSVVAQERFAALAQAVRSVAITTEKDAVVFDELLRAPARVIGAREERLTVSTTRIPRTLWNLVLFASMVLFGGFLALGLHSRVLAVLAVAASAGTLTFLLSVLKDMDNPFVGVWKVSYVPLTNVASRVA